MRAALEEAVGPLGRALLGFGAAFLPKRLWGRWDGQIPIRAASLLAAIATICGSFAVGVPGFFEYAMAISAHGVDTALQQGPAQEFAFGGAIGMSALSLFAFLFLTPKGWLTLYLGLTGLARFGAATVEEPFGDPLLTGLDALSGRARAALRDDTARRERERLEGPAVSDVLLTGRDGGAPEADFVVVASRRKPGWEPGVFVVTPERWYRIGKPFDRRYPNGLRVLYPLTEVGAAEILRRSVAYDLPRLSESHTEGPATADE
jgi:hypothetical protein